MTPNASARNPVRSGRSLLVVLGAVLAVLLAAGVWLWFQPATQPGPDEGQAVAESFLKAIVAGRPAEAWSSTTAEFKSAEGQESFLRLVKAKPVLAQPLDFISMQSVTIQDQPRSEYLFRDPKSGATARIVIGSEAGLWKVDRLLLETSN